MARRPELNQRFTSKLERATNLLGQLRVIEQQETQVHFEMVGLDKGPGDTMPPTGPGQPEKTYGQRLEELAAQRARFRSAFPDEYALAEEMHDRQEREQDRAIAAQAEAEATAAAEAPAAASSPAPSE